MSLFFVLLLLLVSFDISDSKRLGNEKFKKCCARQINADKECKHRFCDFDSINQNNILFFLNTCKPRNDTVSLMWDCASTRVDHTECCKQRKVNPACIPYCASNKPVADDYFKHVFCLNNFDGIRDCFRAYLDKNPNIFGDE
ncbi:hypothetical protein PMAYCL1PPCAC_06970 [Pristionchus mayeri]|uniref:Domain of unknown function DB domain-containing protein n=1 Tax=Pristionchus mayeri TaxID=1317129 RepID=A0AAN4ZFK6_9BILA|nr:hypothetical protein PMAYCL1PPCAC_06970 [Pristionchus mayeri]